MSDEKNILPLSVEEARTIEISSEDWITLGDRFRHPETSKEALLAIAEREGIFYAVLTRVAESPQADEEVLEALTKKARHRWEWRAIYTRFCKLYESFISNYNDKEPFSNAMISGQFGTPSLAAAYISHTGGMLAEDLWHDLATRNIIELDYQADTIDGDQFGPLYDSYVGIGGSSAQYLLSPGYFCGWIDREPEADLGYVIDSFADDYAEDYLSEEMYKEADEITDNSYAMLVAMSYGIANNHIEITNEKKLTEKVTEWVAEFDEEMVDQLVTIVDTPGVEGKRFQDLSAEEITSVLNNLLMAHKHFFPRTFGVTEHLISLILMHPHTTDDHKAMVLSAVNHDEFKGIIKYLDK